MKDYLIQLKTICFPMYRKLKNDSSLYQKIIEKDPEFSERSKVLMWNFIKIAFKYAMVQKLEYDMDSLDDIESFYDEIYVAQLIKYEINKSKSSKYKVKTLIEEDANEDQKG